MFALDLCCYCHALGPDPDDMPRNRTPHILPFHDWAAQHWREGEQDFPDATPRWQRLAEKRAQWLQYVHGRNGEGEGGRDSA